jgi:hypothetical protein
MQVIRLRIADAKAIRHILQGSSYLYEKPPVANEFLATVIDGGVGASRVSRLLHLIYPNDKL